MGIIIDDGIIIDRPLVVTDVGRMGEKALVLAMQEMAMAAAVNANAFARVLIRGIFRVMLESVFLLVCLGFVSACIEWETWKFGNEVMESHENLCEKGKEHFS